MVSKNNELGSKIRDGFWERLKPLDKFLNRIRNVSRHYWGLKGSKEFDIAYENFKKSVMKLDEFFAIYTVKERSD